MQAELAKAFAEHRGQVRAWARGFGVWERDVEDAAQDVAVAMVRGFHSYDRARPLGPWLKTITFRVVRDRWARKGGSDRVTKTGVVDPVDAGAGAPELLEDQERAAEVREALAELAPELRSVLELCAVEELTQEAAAAALNVPVPTVQSWLRRGKVDLARRIIRARARRRS
jgi:RNA polymerase sigma-70 factor (ECF subfamily)